MGGAKSFGQGFGAAASMPLTDLNLQREQIPVALLRARQNQYQVPDGGRCDLIAREVRALNDALGPDMDEPLPPEGSRGDRTARMASNLALDGVRDLATDFIPGRSWIRRLSGAAQHSEEVQTAIQAGRMRRSFLKGIGMQNNCSPPAAPSWYRPTMRF